MALLEVHHPTRGVSQLTLSKREPVSVGSHNSNDIVVDESGVGVLHCRVSWNKEAYEVVSAGSSELSVNGTVVHVKSLVSGDVIDVGSAQIRFLESENATRLELDQPETGGFKPISEELKVADANKKSALPPTRVAPPKEEKPKDDKRGEQREKDRDRKARKEAKRKKEKSERRSRRKMSDSFDALWTKLKAKDEKAVGGEAKEARSEKAGEERVLSWQERARYGAPVRPGEESLLKSPVLVGIAITALILLLSAGTYSFLILRNLAQQRYDVAVAARDEGRYQQAIELYERFLELYPRHSLTEPARIGLAETRIEESISGSSTDWDGGLELLNEFIQKQRDRPNFSDLHVSFVKYGERIAVGAATLAGKTFKRDLLATSEAGEEIAQRYQDRAEPLTETFQRIETAQVDALKSIRREETLRSALGKIDAAIAAGETVAGLRERRDLTTRYPELDRLREVSERVETLLALEAESVAIVDVNRLAEVAVADDPDYESVTIAISTRIRSDIPRSGSPVFTINHGTCFAVDDATGNPMWTLDVGEPTAFFPIRCDRFPDRVLMYHTKRERLVCHDTESGELIWSQACPATPAGRPLFRVGRIYQALTNGELWVLNEESGELLTSVKFPRAIVGPPTLWRNGAEMIVAGYEEVLYTLRLSPLSCMRCSNLGHATGQLEQPLINAGELLLATLGTAEATRLIAMQRRDSDSPFVVREETGVLGTVQDPMIVRGNRLLVATRPERITAFAISDQQDDRCFQQIATTRVPSQLESRLHMIAGTDDRFWVSGSDVLRYQLRPGAILDDTPEKQAEVVDSSHQPLQQRGAMLYFGRKRRFSDAVELYDLDRETMEGTWKCYLGASPLALLERAEGSGLFCVNEHGFVSRLTWRGFSEEFVEQSLHDLTTRREPSGSFFATRLDQERLCVWWEEAPSACLVIDALGQIMFEREFDREMTAAPVLVGKRLAIALDDRVMLFPFTGGGEELLFLTGAENEQRSITQLFAAWDDLLLAEVGGETIKQLQINDAKPAHLAEGLSFSPGGTGRRHFFLNERRELVTVFDEGQAGGRAQILDATSFSVKKTVAVDARDANVELAGDWLVIETPEELKMVSLARDDQSYSLEASAGLTTTPVMFEDLLILPQSDATVRAIDTTTGRLVGECLLPNACYTPPLVAGNAVVLGLYDGRLVRLGRDDFAAKFEPLAEETE